MTVWNPCEQIYPSFDASADEIELGQNQTQTAL